MTNKEQIEFDNLCKIASLTKKRLIEINFKGKLEDMNVEESILNDEEMIQLKEKLLPLIGIKVIKEE